MTRITIGTRNNLETHLMMVRMMVMVGRGMRGIEIGLENMAMLKTMACLTFSPLQLTLVPRRWE